MTIVTTLVPALLYRGRAVGNSTRQANYAIDELFKGYKVLVRDHYQNGEHWIANDALVKKIHKIITPLLIDKVLKYDSKDQSLILEPKRGKIKAWYPDESWSIENFLNLDEESRDHLYYGIFENYPIYEYNSKIYELLKEEGSVCFLKDKEYALASHKMLKGLFIIEYIRN